MEYKCIDELRIEMVDDDGFFTEKYITIKVGSIWTKSDEIYRFIGGEMRLESEKNGWLEITECDLVEYFEEIKL